MAKHGLVILEEIVQNSEEKGIELKAVLGGKTDAFVHLHNEEEKVGQFVEQKNGDGLTPCEKMSGDGLTQIEEMNGDGLTECGMQSDDKLKQSPEGTSGITETTSKSKLLSMRCVHTINSVCTNLTSAHSHHANSMDKLDVIVLDDETPRRTEGLTIWRPRLKLLLIRSPFVICAVVVLIIGIICAVHINYTTRPREYRSNAYCNGSVIE